MMPRFCLYVVAMVLVVLGASGASAGPDQSKVHPALWALYNEHTAYLTQKSVFPFASRDPMVRVIDQRVVIDAVADGDVTALEAELAALGMQNMAVFGRMVSGELPLSAIPALDTIATLRFARPSAARRRTGSVTSPGDRAMRADVARAAFGVTGAGVQGGVLSPRRLPYPFWIGAGELSAG